MTGSIRLAHMVIFLALAILLTFFQFPLIPSVAFLKIDFSLLPVLLVLVSFGKREAIMVLMTKMILSFFLHNQGMETVIGLPLNFLAGLSFMLVFGLFLKKGRPQTYWVAASLATIVMTIVMCFANLLIAMPLYSGLLGIDLESLYGLSGYLFGAILPFNMLAGISYSIIFFAIWHFLPDKTIR